jgi:hypothetical protein
MREPTAWINKERDVITFDNLFPEMTPLYEKREWVGLTDEELDDCYDNVEWNTIDWCPDHHQLAIAVEAKLKEKNT